MANALDDVEQDGDDDRQAALARGTGLDEGGLFGGPGLAFGEGLVGGAGDVEEDVDDVLGVGREVAEVDGAVLGQSVRKPKS